MKVIDWIQGKHEYETSIGGMGGYFEKGMRGNKDYFSLIHRKVKKYYKALRNEIVSRKIKIGGDTHQNSMTPLFSDNTTGDFTYRAWGDLMAAIWSEEESKDYCYMDFYMQCLIKE